MKSKSYAGSLSLALLFLAFGCAHISSSRLDPLIAIHIQDRNGFTETVSSPERLENYTNVDFLSSQPYRKVLRVFKNNGKNHSIITSYHPNGSIAQYLEAKEMRANGVYREWFPNGQLKIEASVIGGTADITQGAQKDWLFDGINNVWDEDGHLTAQIPYHGGSLEGVSVLFYPSGFVKSQIPYVKNMEEGEQIEFYPNGSVKSKITFARGIRTGKSVGFFDSGKKAWEEEYADSLLLGGHYYNLQEGLIGEVEDGRGIQARYENNSILYLLEIRQGTPEGMVKQFNSKGHLLSIYSIKSSKKHGEEIAYYPLETGEKEPKQKLSIQWDHGSVHGIMKTWYQNGQLQSQREYVKNQKLGPSCAWYKNGSLMFIEEYEEGVLTKGAYYKKNRNEPISTVMNGNGIAHLYDEDGIFMKKITYAKGKPIDPED